MGDISTRGRQGDIHRVGVAAKVICRFEQGHVGMAAQAVRHGKARDASADDGHFHGMAQPKARQPPSG